MLGRERLVEEIEISHRLLEDAIDLKWCELGNFGAKQENMKH